MSITNNQVKNMYLNKHSSCKCFACWHKCLDEKTGIVKNVFSLNIVVQEIWVLSVNALDRWKYMYLFHSLKKNIKHLINWHLLSCFTDSNTKNWQKDRPEDFRFRAIQKLTQHTCTFIGWWQLMRRMLNKF